MKVFKFIDMVRQSKREKEFMVAPPLGRNMPLCHACQRNVDAVKLEHVSNKSLEIRVRCHGKEDSCRVDFPFRLRPDAMEAEGDGAWATKRAMADYVAFQESHTENASTH